jgi:hypothetical protein
MDKELFRKNFAVEPGTVLKVANKTGEIHVSGWERDTIEVVAVRKMGWWTSFLPEPGIDVTPGKEFVVRTVYSGLGCKAVPIEYRIVVPKGVLVQRVENSTGKISVDQVTGDLSAITATGEIDIHAVNGNINVVTSTGKVAVDGVSGDVDAKTSAGEIQIHDVKGFVRAVTKFGKIEMTRIGGLYEARTSAGKIIVDIPAFRDNLDIISSTGLITVFLSPEIAAQLEASTSAGQITYEDLPLKVSESSNNKLAGKLGEGGGRISIRTSTGRIQLKKLDGALSGR